MKAVVFHAIGDIRVDEVPEPKLQDPTDALIRVTSSAICGTDLHMIRGTETRMQPGRIMGHEAVGVVEQVGSGVKEVKPGDRVVVTSSIACGSCKNCQAGLYSICLRANPKGPHTLGALFGGPEETGGFDGLQAEKARIPYADTTLIKLPDSINDEQAILLSDILPTAYFAAEQAQIQDGNTVAIFGCGPVGLLTILCAQLRGAGRIFAVDTIPSRLEKARQLGAEVIDFNADDPVSTLTKLTGTIGVDRVIDAVGVDANRPYSGFQQIKSLLKAKSFKDEQQKVAPETNPQGDNWHPGDAPNQVLWWGVNSLAKAGTFAVIGVYPEKIEDFPIGIAMNKNITITSGHCNHRKYIPGLINLVAQHLIDPTVILTENEPLTDAITAYKAFDERETGWIKVRLEPSTIH